MNYYYYYYYVQLFVFLFALLLNRNSQVSSFVLLHPTLTFYNQRSHHHHHQRIVYTRSKQLPVKANNSVQLQYQSKNDDNNNLSATSTTTSSSISFLILNAVAILWGTQHLVIKDAVLSYPSPALLNFARFLLSSLCFLPVAWMNNDSLSSNDRNSDSNNYSESYSDSNMSNDQSIILFKAGSELGLYIFLGFAFQAIGLVTTSASRSAFLLYLNVKLVPFFASLLYGRRISSQTWFSALLALVGTFLLSTDGGPINTGDIWCIAAAASSALYILRLENFTNIPAINTAQLNGVCNAVVTFLCFIWLGSDLLFASTVSPLSQEVVNGDHQRVMELLTHWATVLMDNPLPPLYLGIVISGLCGYLQSIGQKNIPAERAAIIF